MTLNIPPMLNVFRHDTDNQALVTLTGEIDMDSAPLVRESLGQCLRDGIRTIDVDVTTVTFCDCSGLNTFLHALLHTAASADPCTCTTRARRWSGSSPSPAPSPSSSPSPTPSPGARQRCSPHPHTR